MSKKILRLHYALRLHFSTSEVSSDDIFANKNAIVREHVGSWIRPPAMGEDEGMAGGRFRSGGSVGKGIREHLDVH